MHSETQSESDEEIEISQTMTAASRWGHLMRNALAIAARALLRRGSGLHTSLRGRPADVVWEAALGESGSRESLRSKWLP